MAKLLQLRRGTTSQHSSFTGAVGEVTVDTDKDTIVVHDGSTAAGFPLAPNASPTFTGSHIRIPSVTTANRPGESGGTNASVTPYNGMLIYNSTLEILQQRAGGDWSGIKNIVPNITSFQYSDGATATAEKTVVGLVSISCTTQTSTTVLVPDVSLGIQIGMVVSGVGIPLGATVVSVILDTSFVISEAATASATVTLTFGGVVTITGSRFDSILGGDSANIAVTFDDTSATAISVNALATVITCTPPAHAAGTIILKVTNSDGNSAETNFIYDEEAIFTTAAGSLGSFVDGVFAATAAAPRIQGTEDIISLSCTTTNTNTTVLVPGSTTGIVVGQVVSGTGIPTSPVPTVESISANTSFVLSGAATASGTVSLTFATVLTTGFQQVTSAADDTVITTGIQGLTVLTSGYLTGTLSASEGTTYPFYATAKDSQNQRTAPRLFNIISSHPASGGTVSFYTGFNVHIFTTYESAIFTPLNSMNVDILIVAGGGGGGGGFGGGGGAGGVLYASSFALTAQDYTVVVGGRGGKGISNQDHPPVTYATMGGLSSFGISGGTTATAYGGGPGQTTSGGSWTGGNYVRTNMANGGGTAHGSGDTGEAGTQPSATGFTGYGGYTGGTDNSGHPNYPQGGGAGAQADGGSPANTSAEGGEGGVGKQIAGMGTSGATWYWGGGGGGDAHDGAKAGDGGLGGGGGGATYAGTVALGGAGFSNGASGGVGVNTAGGAGGANSGGGGGGGANVWGDGGSGGGGIVIIRYAV